MYFSRAQDLAKANLLSLPALDTPGLTQTMTHYNLSAINVESFHAAYNTYLSRNIRKIS